MGTTTPGSGEVIARAGRFSIIEASADDPVYKIGSFAIGGGKLKKYTQDTPEQSSPSEKPKRVVKKDEFYHAFTRQLSRGMQGKMVPDYGSGETETSDQPEGGLCHDKGQKDHQEG